MKRSSQVALLLMGTAGIGAGAYAMSSPRTDCVTPSTPASSTVAPAIGSKATTEPCQPRRSTSTGYHYWYGSHWSRPIFWRRSSTASTTPPGSVALTSRGGTPSSSSSSSSSVSRVGFGTTGHAMSSSS